MSKLLELLRQDARVKKFIELLATEPGISVEPDGQEVHEFKTLKTVEQLKVLDVMGKNIDTIMRRNAEYTSGGGGKKSTKKSRKSIRRKSSRRKSTRRKSTRRKSNNKRKSSRIKSIKRKSSRKKSKSSRRR